MSYKRHIKKLKSHTLQWILITGSSGLSLIWLTIFILVVRLTINLEAEGKRHWSTKS